MSKVDTFACDNCGSFKKESNHWWVVAVCTLTPSFLMVGTWSSLSGFSDHEIHHLCSIDCCLKWISRWMGKGSDAVPAN